MENIKNEGSKIDSYIIELNERKEQVIQDFKDELDAAKTEFMELKDVDIFNVKKEIAKTKYETEINEIDKILIDCENIIKQSKSIKDKFDSDGITNQIAKKVNKILNVMPEKFYELSDKDRNIASYYLVTYHKENSAVLAGVMKGQNQYTQRLWAKPLFKEYLQFLRDELRSDFNISLHEQVKYLVDMRNKLTDLKDYGSMNLLIKINEQINKLLGFGNLDSVKLDYNFKVNFGNAIPNERVEINTEYEDVDRVEDEEDDDEPVE